MEDSEKRKLRRARNNASAKKCRDGKNNILKQMKKEFDNVQAENEYMKNVEKATQDQYDMLKNEFIIKLALLPNARALTIVQDAKKKMCGKDFDSLRGFFDDLERILSST